MRALSLSQAWDETKAIITRDGQLFGSVALALVALPAAIEGLVAPRGMDRTTPVWVDLLILVASLVAVGGQLALIRLAVGPSITVGGAIAHGMRRMPFYFLAVILLVIGLFVLAIPIAAVLMALGRPLPANGAPASPPVLIAAVLYVALAFFLGVRMLMSAAVASAERLGPIAILRRSWELTAGHWWLLFGFLAMICIVALVLLVGATAAAGVVVRLVIGDITPLSLGALVVALVSALLNAVFTTGFAVMLARVYVQLAGRGGEVAEVFR
jgi:hypothetical protein